MRDKMGTCLPMVCCAIVICGILVPAARGSPYSSPYAAMRSSQCLIRKLSASRYFDDQDRSDMVGITNVMSNMMLNMEFSSRGRLSLKVILTAFAASLADIIILDDPTRNYPRKTAYFLALRECSAQSTGRVDEDYIRESLRILTTLENGKVSPQYEEPFTLRRTNIQLPAWRFNSENFRPSYVQNSFLYRNYGIRERNAFQPRRTTRVFQTNMKPSTQRKLSSSIGTSESFRSSRILERREHSMPSSSNIPRAKFRNFIEIASRYSSVPPMKRIVTRFTPAVVKSRTHLPPDNYSSLESKQNSNEMPDYKNLSPSKDSLLRSTITPPGIKTQFRDYTAKKTQNETTRDMNYGKDLKSSSLFEQTGVDIHSEKNSNRNTFIQSSSSINKPLFAINSPQSESYIDDSCLPDITPQESYSEKDTLFESETERTSFPTDSIQLSPETKFIDEALPIDNYQFVKKLPSRVYSVEDEEGTSVQPTRAPDLPLSSEDVALGVPFLQQSVPSVSAPLIHSLQVNHYSLESIISDILRNSASFKNVFGSKSNQPKFITLARTITSQSLSGYDPKIIKEALDAVTNAVSTVVDSSPENYALAISKALAAVLKLHSIPLFENQSAAKRYFQDTKGDYGQQANATKTTLEISIKQDDIPFAQHSPLNSESPEDINAALFSNTLYQKLIGSFRLAYLFCSSDFGTDEIQVYFTLVKNSLSMYGSQIASIIANRISKALIEIADESLCNNYAKVISFAIAEILYENELLEKANAQDIINQFEINANRVQQKAKKSEESAIKTDYLLPTNEGNKFTEIPILQSSLSINYSGEPQDSALSPALGSVSISIKKKSDNVENDSDHFLDKEQLNNMPKFGQDLLVEPTRSSITSLSSEQLSNNEGDNYYTIPSTTTLCYEITTPRYNELTHLIDEIPNIAGGAESNDSESTQEYLNSDSAAPIKSLILSSRVLSDTSVLRNNPKSMDQDSSVPISTFTLSKESALPEEQQTDMPIIPFSGSFLGRNTTRTMFQGTPRQTAEMDTNSFLSIARVISQIAESSVKFIRSRNFDLEELCKRLNAYAEIMSIPPVRNCEGIAVIDYLLNVLSSVTKRLKGI